jgi:colicin import membrane protein
MKSKPKGDFKMARKNSKLKSQLMDHTEAVKEQPKAAEAMAEAGEKNAEAEAKLKAEAEAKAAAEKEAKAKAAAEAKAKAEAEAKAKAEAERKAAEAAAKAAAEEKAKKEAEEKQHIHDQADLPVYLL